MFLPGFLEKSYFSKKSQKTTNDQQIATTLQQIATYSNNHIKYIKILKIRNKIQKTKRKM